MNRRNTAAILIIGIAAYLLYKVVKGATMKQETNYQFPNGFNDLSNWKDADDGSKTFENRLTRFMVGIAKAEGYGIPGAIPTIAHNPGDLTAAEGYALSASKLLGAGIVEFIDDGTGWAALEHQLRIALNGSSTEYNPSMTVDQFASIWTATNPQGWAQTVSENLQSDSTTSLSTIFA